MLDCFKAIFCPGGEDGAEEEAEDVWADLSWGVGDEGAGCALRWWLGDVGGVLDPASEGGLGGRCLWGGGRAPRRGAGPELSEGVGGSPLLQAIEQ